MTFSRNWLEQSDAAKAENVCHTEAECGQMYSEIPQEQKDAAIQCFRDSEYAPSFPEVRQAIADDPDNWIASHHMFWGMGVRNFFRQHGFGEEFFAVDNMDCIYRRLVEDAVKE